MGTRPEMVFIEGMIKDWIIARIWSFLENITVFVSSFEFYTNIDLLSEYYNILIQFTVFRRNENTDDDRRVTRKRTVHRFAS